MKTKVVIIVLVCVCLALLLLLRPYNLTTPKIRISQKKKVKAAQSVPSCDKDSVDQNPTNHIKTKNANTSSAKEHQDSPLSVREQMSKPVVELLKEQGDKVLVKYKGATLTLSEAADLMYDFLTQNGEDVGIKKIGITKEKFLAKTELTGTAAGCYWFFFDNTYSLWVCAADGTIRLYRFPVWAHIDYGDEPNQAKSEEKALKVLKRIAKISLEEGKQIALAFIRRNYPNFKEEEFDLVVCRVAMYENAGWDCYYEYEWRRKKKLPGYALVYPTEIAIQIDPKSGLIHFYITGMQDWKVREPPKISKEEAIKIAKRVVQISGFDKLDLDNPEVSLEFTGSYANPPTRPARLFWYIFFRTSKEFRKEQYAKCNYDIPHGREILIDAYTGEVLDDATRW